MGNLLGRQEDVVDGGSVFPMAQGSGKTDSDLRAVRRLVLDRKLAPFFQGTGDPTTPLDVECPICFLVRRTARATKTRAC